MSHLLIISGHHAIVTPPVDTQAAVTALGVLAEAGTYDTGPHGSERLLVVEADVVAAIRSRAARSRS